MYKYLKVWGCLAKVEVPPPKQVTIGPKTVDCIFIGYALNSSAYRFIVHKSENPNMTEGTTIESRNVVFFENIFPCKDKVQQTPNENGEKRARTSSPDLEEVEPRRSKRVRTEKSFGPDFVTYLIDNDPRTLTEALSSPDAPYWKEAVNNEIDSIM